VSQRFVTALLIIIGREEGVRRITPSGWPAPLQRPALVSIAGRLSWLAWLALCTEQKGFMISNPAGHLSWGHNRDLDLPVCACLLGLGANATPRNVGHAFLRLSNHGEISPILCVLS